jgi:dolichol-phosphate mannosyltransferase
MLTSQSMPRTVAQVLSVTQRFQRFLLVGAIGLAINQAILFILVDFTAISVVMASPVAIATSMVATFVLNERWTWHDRGRGSLANRALLYGTINSAGLVINWFTLVALHRLGMNYLVANLVGAGLAAIWNFSLNHALTWRR